MQEEVAPNEAYEHSEMLLYRAMVLEEGGHLDEALTHLDLCQVPPPVLKEADDFQHLEQALLRHCRLVQRALQGLSGLADIQEKLATVC